MKKFFKLLISKAFWINMAIMVLVILGGIFGVSMFLESYTKHDDFVEVPDFTGFHYSEIEDFITDKNLRFEISDSIFDPSKEGGIVLEQIPISGEKVKSDRKIYLTINSVTPPSVTLPELRDITVRQVVSKIKTYGLKVDSLIYKPAECDNCVIGVMYNGKEILPGDEIEKGKSITLIIGEGIGTLKVAIPYLYKLTLAEVRGELNSMGLNLGFPTYDSTIISADDSNNAFVFRQTPTFDTANSVRQGTAFDIYLTLDSNKLEGIQLNVADTTVSDTIHE